MDKKTLKEWRNERGLQTRYVAEKLGIKTSTFCHKEKGRRHFNVAETQALLDIYKIDLSQVEIV